MEIKAYKTDFHMHTTVSDGTDTPEEIISKIKDLGLAAFAITDHDAILGCRRVINVLTGSDPKFLTGVEFNSRDEDGKYHILGYGYDPDSEHIIGLVNKGHEYRMRKFRARIDFLEREFGFDFPTEKVNELLALDNPGKPHIGNLMVSLGYTATKEEAINQYINKAHIGKSEYIRPETAIEGILAAGGIPVLAHPSYGSGDELIIGEELDERIKKLKTYGLQGVEGFYSGFTKVLSNEVIGFARKYDLYVTAGSDYHGRNKLIELGDTTLTEDTDLPEGYLRFIKRVSDMFAKV